MSESQNNGININSAQVNAPTTAQTDPGTGQVQGTFNTAGYTAGATSPASQQPYAAPGYVQGTPVFTQYRPAQETPKTRRLSAPARAVLWICGIAAALTLLFGCAVVWVVGYKAIQNAISSAPSHSSSENGSGGSQGGNAGSGGSQGGSEDPGEYGGFGFSDGFGGNDGGFPDYGDYGSILPFFDNDDPSSSSQSSKAGLGVKVTEIQLEFIIEDKYTSGLIIVEIGDDSAFKGTEVREHDLIVAMDGSPTFDYDTLKSLLGRKNPGDSVEFTIARYENGVASTYDVTVELIELSGD